MKKIKAKRLNGDLIEVSFKHKDKNYANTIELTDDMEENRKLIETTINNIIITVKD